MKRAISFLLALMLAMTLAVPALGEVEIRINTDNYLHALDLPELGLNLRLTWAEQCTFVTAENLEEHADLVTARGDTMENARFRFANAGILFEAYCPEKIPDGVIRVQRFEDEWSRNIWSMCVEEPDRYTTSLLQAMMDEWSGTLYQGYMRLFNVRRKSDINLDRYSLIGSVNWYPPFDYESGMFKLFCTNGVFYMVSYMSLRPASTQKNYSYQDYLYENAITNTPIGGTIRLISGTKEETPVTDLGTDRTRLILNAHSGPFTLTGTTERGAAVRVTNGDQSWEATVDGLNYTCGIELQPGENTVVSAANKQGLRENTLERVIAVDDGIAALELTEFPYGAVPRSEVTAKGKTSPGASVTVTIDDGEPREAAVEADGAFSYTLPVGEVEDWVDHTIAIAAHEEGLEDCTARFTFSTEYDEASQGIAAYRKTLSGGVTGWTVNKDPAAHVGERMALEVRTLTVDRRDGILSVECCIDSDESRPVILVYPNYMDDEIAPFMVITVYGEIVEPAQMDPPVPRMEVEYTQNLIIEYIRWRY